MNKTAIKNYAIWARIQLIESARQRTFEYEITEDGQNDPELKAVSGRVLNSGEIDQRKELISLINQKGFDQVMEEAAYTWFNRFIALRFMEVNGYLPTKVRVFTDENNEFKPDILKEAMSIDLEGIDRDKVFAYLDEQDNEGLYKYLLITQCNALNKNLPYMFEQISNWTELLFPSNLLRPDGVLGQMISEIPEEDWEDAVEVIGWLYQYYISEKHEEVIDVFKGKAIKKEDIPAATQLFTTDWVVKYIVDNSLGRYWIERNPRSTLADKLTYFVKPKDGVIEYVDEKIRPEEIKVLDPCVGSGHFLAYAFDVLIEMYRECGWSDRDAAKSIIENNLYGLDIDERAAQLAWFSVMMKARRYNRRVFSSARDLNIQDMVEPESITEEVIRYVASDDIGLKEALEELCRVFKDAKELGSIIKVLEIDLSKIKERVHNLNESNPNSLEAIGYQKVINETLIPMIRQTEILTHKYEAVVTNPPYMNKFGPLLKKYITDNYADYKGDLFSVFMYRNFGFCRQRGYSGFMTPMVWMFIKTYEPLREHIITQKRIETLIQFEYSAFEEATVPICAFVLKNKPSKANGYYFKLSEFRGGMDVQNQKVLEALKNRECGYYYESTQDSFSKIPGSPIAYWVSKNILSLFGDKTVASFGEAKSGMTTTDNNRFLRLWYEPDYEKIGFGYGDISETTDKKYKWYPFCKGGDFRRWAGNEAYVVNWFDNGREIRKAAEGATGGRLVNVDVALHECVVWTKISSSVISFRYKNKGVFFSDAAPGLFAEEKENLIHLLGLLNTKYATLVIGLINPTLNFVPGAVSSIPVLTFGINRHEIEDLVYSCVNISKNDWDSFETSWDFKKHPLV